ncbi:MAG: hypothetical protein KAQ84_00335 [Thermoplasmatales archaeon]|nr:hypothetical protein [Thermoplasmatales archaeon]
MHLKLSHEIVGTLHKIKTEQDQIRLIFGIYKEIEIPRDSIPREKLESVVGKKVGIFHSDDGVYKLRKIKA